MKEMKLTFVNVGYGEAILMECPVGGARPYVILIDGGSAESAEYASAESGRIRLTEYLRKNGPDHIDLLVSTHTHEDHVCAALQAAQLLPPREIWQSLPTTFYRETRPLDASCAETASQSKFLRALNDYGALCRLAESSGSSIRQMCAGMEVTPCAGLRIQVLAPSREREQQLEDMMRNLYSQKQDTLLKAVSHLDGQMNNFSLMLLLDWQGTRVLLPGDTNRLGYGDIAPEMLAAHIFKVGHHGQIDGADQALLDAVHPRAVVCCASSDRRYNSAHSTLLNKIRDSGAELYFSDAPDVPGMTVPPHQALTFVLGADGAFTAAYH